MASRRTHMRPRDRLLVVLGVCLPVPVFAATGLSLPLPATVERMATELGPVAQPVTPAEGGVASGSIVLTEAERLQARTRPLASRTRVAVALAPQREVAQRRQGKPAGNPAGPSRSDDTLPVEHPVTPDPAPVALAPLTPPAEDSKIEDGHEPKPVREHQAKRKPKPKPERKQKAKPKQERASKPKDEPKPEEKPRPPKPKPDPEEEPPAKVSGESAGKDNGPDAGKPSESERRQSP
jgi:hypothetical protein